MRGEPASSRGYSTTPVEQLVPTKIIARLGQSQHSVVIFSPPRRISSSPLFQSLQRKDRQDISFSDKVFQVVDPPSHTISNPGREVAGYPTESMAVTSNHRDYIQL